MPAFLLARAGDRASAAAIVLYSFTYVIQHHLMHPTSWLFAFLYMLFGLTVVQRIVIRRSGMRYTDFLKNVTAAPRGR
jgi:hypothetical protein